LQCCTPLHAFFCTYGYSVKFFLFQSRNARWASPNDAKVSVETSMFLIYFSILFGSVGKWLLYNTGIFFHFSFLCLFSTFYSFCLVVLLSFLIELCKQVFIGGSNLYCSCWFMLHFHVVQRVIMKPDSLVQEVPCFQVYRWLSQASLVLPMVFYQWSYQVLPDMVGRMVCLTVVGNSSAWCQEVILISNMWRLEWSSSFSFMERLPNCEL
jgi:hypothetical protein